MAGPVYPLAIVPRDWRGDYPAMAKRDAQVWARWLTRFADRFLGFAYNVAMGGVTLAVPEADPATLTMFRYQTAVKIDAVAFSADEAWIIEVKPEAQAGALGAVIAYTLVAERDQVFDRALRGAIVCEYCQPDTKWCAERLGIAVYELGLP